MMTIRATHAISLVPGNLAPIVTELFAANRAFMEVRRGESDRRQAVHPVDGGVHLFEADPTGRLAEVALRSPGEFVPTPADLARILGEDWQPSVVIVHKILTGRRDDAAT